MSIQIFIGVDNLMTSKSYKYKPRTIQVLTLTSPTIIATTYVMCDSGSDTDSDNPTDQITQANVKFRNYSWFVTVWHQSATNMSLPWYEVL